MIILNRAVLSALLLVLVLSGCGTGRADPVAPQISDEAACYVSINPAKCKLAHDKAGGYPFQANGSDR